MLDPEGAVKIMEHLNRSLSEIFQDARTRSPKSVLNLMEPENE